ncbi:hypothetical protein BJX68DRAFT_242299 [Aspergillus pseudodeflectus]|uniref:Uncharacterized protein n=1 Tax=Aspergillus pseudodeflectus TaxID=176178 RepID=A0ABR4JZC4_9EURO
MSPIELPGAAPKGQTKQSHDYPNTTNGNPMKPLSETKLYRHCFHLPRGGGVGHRGLGTGRE